MKKLLIILGLFTITALSGCSKDSANRDVYEESGNTINVNNKRHELYNEGASRDLRDVSRDYGFVRHQKSPVMNDNETDDHYAALDREQIANIISKFSTSMANVNDAATLVTDQEVLVVYDTDTKDRNFTADQVKRTALSVVPRYYHVYVSDNKTLMRDLENLAHLDSGSAQARNQVVPLIKKMLKSPQGNPVDTNEDANGRTADDNNMKNKLK
ncbi:YhcN/YlaJ family sporulation lipoprotein [Neobacillus dielmonensis]|uniref:YhcN/YlaJ family sporulation lipoprotein n=1 Tax=Neobacillus dielmonensis TaxID=1347369 RepID=UPI0005A690DD|nr:YhcN/YlaJ family sporulation lipoprotein [Neobacillus dielmonensis]